MENKRGVHTIMATPKTEEINLLLKRGVPYKKREGGKRKQSFKKRKSTVYIHRE